MQDEHNRRMQEEGTGRHPFCRDELPALSSDDESSAGGACSDEPTSSAVADEALSKILPLLNTKPLHKRKYIMEIHGLDCVLNL